MKIAVIIGSPRKKDSFNICHEIENQIKQYNEDIEFDYIILRDYHIDDCKGCMLCFQKSENLCPCKDDWGCKKTADIKKTARNPKGYACSLFCGIIILSKTNIPTSVFYTISTKITTGNFKKDKNFRSSIYIL